MQRIWRMFSGEGLKAKSLRGAFMAVASIGGGNVLRLMSNLILTRLLFPEAFGLMALVQVVMSGLQMFSDVGINTSIVQNKRGDEPIFLNTAWVIQIIRGFILWIFVCLLANPVANIYEQPLLATLLPVAGFTAVIVGFTSTKIATAQRHLNLGLLTVIELCCQAFSIIVSVVAAYLLQSVWALVIGAVSASAVKVLAVHIFLPGMSNRFQWETKAFLEMINFGKYIFLSTVSGFLLKEGSRIILGLYVTLAQLGIFGVGQILGTLPLLAFRAIAGKVIFPLYRMRPPDQSPENRAQLLRARRLTTVAMLGLNTVFCFAGIALINALYDPRYALAGPIVVITSLAIVPRLVFGSHNRVLLSYGNSRTYFLILALAALIQTILLFFAVREFGIVGAILAPGITAILVYPLWAHATNKYNAWDPKADSVLFFAALVINGTACWWHRDELMQLFG